MTPFKVTLAWPFFVLPFLGTEEYGMKLTPICKNNEFRRAYARGKSYVTPLVVVYVLKNRYRQVRVGITTSKKIGNAVARNRSRRVIREAFREIAPRIKTGYDLVFVARGRTPHVKSTDVQRHLLRQLETAGVLLPAQQEGPANRKHETPAD